MPLVRIEIIKGKDIDYKKKIMDAVHTALIKAMMHVNALRKYLV